MADYDHVVIRPNRNTPVSNEDINPGVGPVPSPFPQPTEAERAALEKQLNGPADRGIRLAPWPDRTRPAKCP